ncbi:hypothetical protein B0H11DRAFT_1105014 [Mycena galericulata]|nr:hypothetical protein B0H11DRAFT_1105014 [Mycena galericulata]
MLREDRRPSRRFPEDSVNTYMHPFPLYPPPPQESFILDPQYNPTDQNIFDTFPYYPSPNADTYLSTDSLLPVNWAHCQSTDIQDLVYPTQAEYPYLCDIMQSPELPLHTPVHSPLFLPDPESEALTYNPAYSTPTGEWDTITDMTDYIFSNTEYCDFSAPPIADVPPSPPMPEAPEISPRKYKSPRKPRAARGPPPARASGFVPSDPDDLSSHEKKRLYLSCLENYVQYLHQLFASINVVPHPLERVSNYRLTSRSMRTILLHLGKSADTIQSLTVEEESKFKDLHDAAYLPPVPYDGAFYQDYQYEGHGPGAVSPSSDSGSTSSSGTYVTSEPPNSLEILKAFLNENPSFSE